MNKAYFNGRVLPLNFKYKFVPKKRIKILETIDADVVQMRDFYIGDLRISFECEYVERSLADTFLLVYKDGDTVIFKDYDANEWNVILTEYSEEEVSGLVNISGEMKVIPE